MEMHIKGSPRAEEPWRGVNSVVGAPGFRMLNSYPENPPLPKRPTEYHIKEAYLQRLLGDPMRNFCAYHKKLRMFENFKEMVQTFNVPSRRLSTAEFYALPLRKQINYSCYGTVEMIGVPNVEEHVVPFIRAPLHILLEQTVLETA